VVESTAPSAPAESVLLAAAVALAEQSRTDRRVQRGAPPAWRNVVSQPQRTRFEVAGEEHVVEWYGGRDGYRPARGEAAVRAASPTEVVLELEGIAARFEVTIGAADHAGARPVWVDSRLGSVALREVPRFVDPADQVAAGSLLAPMPGTVVAVPVEPGVTVTAGETLLVLEAMKMQHAIKAPADGVVSLEVAVGEQVAAGDVLAVVSGPETEGEDG
jgi:propionyl-CoA carboxylase alpha chain